MKRKTLLFAKVALLLAARSEDLDPKGEPEVRLNLRPYQ
jgi:hypothetical protein